MRSLVVELCGLPGSGKTTVARLTSELLSARSVPCDVTDLGISAVQPRTVRTVRRAASAGRALRRDPACTVRSARAFAGVGQNNGRDLTATLLQWLAVQQLIARAHVTRGVHLVEEGPMQTLWTLLLRSGAPVGAAMSLLHQAPVRSQSHLVVYLEVPVEIAVARLEARVSRHSRTQLLDPPHRAAELLHGWGLMEALAAASPRPVHRLAAGHLDPVELADALAGTVAQALLPAG